MASLFGRLRIHREGATNAPWDCQVDVLLRWDGPMLNLSTLHEAVQTVQRQHPMLRARPPLDDSTDLKLGCRDSGFSTTVAATWSLLCEEVAVPRRLRELVAKAMFFCWPRTAILEDGAALNIPVLSQSLKRGGECNADEVYRASLKHRCDLAVWIWQAHSFRVMNDSGWAWWDSTSALNMCLVNMQTDEPVVQFLYCSITHKYGDGGAIAAFVHSLHEAYQALARGEVPSRSEHPILAVQQQRLRRYLSGAAGQEGAVDVYLFDIVNDTYYHKWGHSVGVQFTRGVCDTLRTLGWSLVCEEWMAGQRMACSEEIAWLSCIVAAMFRMLPDKLLRIMVVHNGRLGDAEGAVACTSNYVMLSIPCLDASSTPLADIASRVKYAITHGKFRRPTTCEQAHARINIGGMIGTDGDFTQVFKSSRCRSSAWSRAPYVIQLRMDNEGGIWCVKDFKCHEFVDPTKFWTAAVCIGREEFPVERSPWSESLKKTRRNQAIRSSLFMVSDSSGFSDVHGIDPPGALGMCLLGELPIFAGVEEPNEDEEVQWVTCNLCEASYNPLGVTVRAMVLLLPRHLLSPKEDGMLKLLQGMAKVWVTGGWLRDKILASLDVNLAARSNCQRLAKLCGQQQGDLDLVVAGMTSVEFYGRCSRDEAFRSLLRRPPLLVEAKGGRPNTVKLTLAEAIVDVTSLADARSGGAQSGPAEEGEEDSIARDCQHRDVSFNALYLEAGGEEVLDPCGQGVSDLSAGIVRTPHTGGALASFREDPVRLLRALRFAARLGFQLEDELHESLAAGEEVLAARFERHPGRILFELKKALLVHNQPSSFLQFLNSNCEVHKLLFGDFANAPTFWQGAVGNVRRLETLILEGLQRKQLSARSVRFRGRMEKGLPPALLTPDWRKLEIRENDWVELLLAALLWRRSVPEVRQCAARLQLLV
eukprot:s1175_g3.t2